MNREKIDLKKIHVLTQRTRFDIAEVLLKSSIPLAFSEIKERLKKNYNDGQIWNHIKTLERYGIINRITQIEINPTTKKPRISFFVLTDDGKEIAQHLFKILKGVSCASFYFPIKILENENEQFRTLPMSFIRNHN